MAPAHTMDAGEHVEASSLAAGAEVSTAPQLQLERGSDSEHGGSWQLWTPQRLKLPSTGLLKLRGLCS